jgi:hypothetical protein
MHSCSLMGICAMYASYLCFGVEILIERNFLSMLVVEY